MKNQKKKQFISKKIWLVMAMTILVMGLLKGGAYAAEEESLDIVLYESVLSTNVGSGETEDKGNLTYATDVTSEMCTSSYWSNKAKESNKVLMTTEEIKNLNQEIIEASGTYAFDLETISSPLSVGFEKFIKNGQNRDVYINGVLIDQDEYIAKYQAAQATSVYFDGTARGEKIYYAVATARADLKAWPTDEILRL